MKDVQLVIPMSGIGKRFIDAGYTDPKPLIEVDGRPMIAHVLDIFNNPEDVIFICNEKHLEETKMREILLELCPTAKIYSVPNQSCRGPVEVVLKHIDKLSDTKGIIISYCDYGTVWDYGSFLNYCDNEYIDGVIPCYTGFHPHMLGNDNYAFCRTHFGLIVDIKEKQPFTDNKMAELASNGTYYFKNKQIIHKYFQKLVDSEETVNNEFYVSMVYNLMANDGLNTLPFLIKKMLQWGTPYDLEIYKGWSKYFSTKSESFSINPTDTELILPMAGDGQRFKDKGYELPKPLLTVDEYEMIISAVESLPLTVLKTFICKKEHIDKYNLDTVIGIHYPFCKIIPIDRTTDGQACTCEIGIRMSGMNYDNPIFISACDNGIIYNAEKYTKLVYDKSVDVIVFSFRNNPTSKNNPDMYSWLTVDNKDNILNVSTKKFNQKDPLKTHAIIGTFFFRQANYFLDGLKRNYDETIRTNNEYYVDDIINQCIKMGLTIKVFEVDNYICWGTPDDYETYNYWLEYFKCLKK